MLDNNSPTKSVTKLRHQLVVLAYERQLGVDTCLGATYAAMAGGIASAPSALGAPWWTMAAAAVIGAAGGAATSWLRTRWYLARTAPDSLVHRYLRRKLEVHRTTGNLGPRPAALARKDATRPGRTVRVQLETAAALAEQLDDQATLAGVLQLSLDAAQLAREELTELSHNLVKVGDELFERAHGRNADDLRTLTTETDAYVAAVTDVTGAQTHESVSAQKLTAGERAQAVSDAPDELRRLHADATSLSGQLVEQLEQQREYPTSLDPTATRAREARAERVAELEGAAAEAVDQLELAAVALNGVRKPSASRYAAELGAALERARKGAEALDGTTNVVPLARPTGSTLPARSDHG